MKSLILCGGLGERLRPHTESIPKVMLEIKGKPILEYVVNFLKKYGQTDLVLLCGYKPEEIENYFGDGKKFGVQIKYSIEKEKLGTGGAVRNARDLIGGGDFLLVNGDVITNFDLNEQKKEFYKSNKKCVMSLVRPENPFGVAEIEDVVGKVCKIKSFLEKPKMKEWIHAGYDMLKEVTIEMFPEKGDAERVVFPKLWEENELLGFLIGDNYSWTSIDTSKDLKKMNE